MKKLLLIGFSVVGLALSAVAGMNSSIKEIETVQALRCNFCKGTGFNPGAPTFTCNFCGGKGWN